MTIELTQLQDRLIANILARPVGDGRSDVLGKATGVPPGSVSASLLTLRSQGIIGSANDGGAYNYWFVTTKGHRFLDERAAEIRRAEQQRRELKARAEAEERRRDQAALKQRLVQQQRDREAQRQQQAQREAEQHARLRERALAAGRSDLGGPVLAALGKAMNAKGWDAISNPKFIVWSPSAPMPPQVQYATRAKADEVAAHMAQRHPNQVFIVCELLSATYYTPPAMQSGAIVRGTL